MASTTETAIAGLVATYAALAAASGAKIPAPKRNEALPTRIPEFSEGVRAWLNILDGDSDAEQSAVAIGGGDHGERAYEFVQRPVIEWVVEAADAEIREQVFDDGLCALYDALVADRSIGGKCGFVEFANLQRSNLNTDGLPGTKAVLVTLAMTLTSARPF